MLKLLREFINQTGFAVQQQQDLCGKAIKVAGNETRNMCECGSDKKMWWP
jgi:hypothetical protein